MTENHPIAEKALVATSRFVSALFTPIYFPFLAFIILFVFSYLSMLPLPYKLIVLGVVFCFTIMMPTLTIFLFYKLCRIGREDMVKREHRFVPFALTIISYIFCLLMMRRMNLPWYMNGIILAALLMMIVCIISNLKWKLSEHMAGSGAVIGGLIAFSELFGYNPVVWLCIAIMVAGLLGTARIILQHHTSGEVLGGLFVGILCALLVLHPFSNKLFRIFLF